MYTETHFSVSLPPYCWSHDDYILTMVGPKQLCALAHLVCTRDLQMTKCEHSIALHTCLRYVTY